MRAHKLTHINAPRIESFDWIPGFYCKGCETYKSLVCEHNFEDDKGRVFEVMFCESCGNIVEETDVTEHYADRAEASAEEPECLHEELESQVCTECGDLVESGFEAEINEER